VIHWYWIKFLKKEDDLATYQKNIFTYQTKVIQSSIDRLSETNFESGCDLSSYPIAIPQNKMSSFCIFKKLDTQSCLIDHASCAQVESPDS
jgi:hypothetical protein